MNKNQKSSFTFIILPFILIVAFAYANYFQYIGGRLRLMEFGITFFYVACWFFLIFITYKIKEKSILLFYSFWWLISTVCIYIASYCYTYYKEISQQLRDFTTYFGIPFYPFTGVGYFTTNVHVMFLIAFIISTIFTLSSFVLFFLVNFKNKPKNRALKLDKTPQ